MSLNKMIARTVKQTTSFAKSDDGAITVDWVVLTAALVGLAGAAALTISASITVLGEKVESDVATTKVGPS